MKCRTCGGTNVKVVGKVDGPVKVTCLDCLTEDIYQYVLFVDEVKG